MYNSVVHVAPFLIQRVYNRHLEDMGQAKKLEDGGWTD
jgi:hypothetical protein